MDNIYFLDINYRIVKYILRFYRLIISLYR